jgi:hypothetical protein
MRARTGIAGTAHRVRLTAVVWGLTTILACVALSACTSSGTGTGTGSGTPTSSVRLLSPAASGSPAAIAASGGTPATLPAGESSPASSPESSSASVSPTESQSPSPSPSPIPTVAPVTGGGGTAGFQDAWLAVLGGAAIVAGLASIAYRRWITRNR